MAKTIKFNLICDGNPVRTIEDLQNNFSVEDILNYFNNGLLRNWLEVRSYDKELTAVNNINDKDSIQIIRKLINIFDIEIEENKIEESVYILKYFNERKATYAQYEKNKFKVDSIINNYHAEYDQLVNRIINASDNAAYIKASIAEIADNYFWIFERDHRRLFYDFFDSAPLAIFFLLSNEKTRYYYLPVEIEVDKEENSKSQKNDSKLHFIFNDLNLLVKTIGCGVKFYTKYVSYNHNTTEIDSNEIKYDYDIDIPELDIDIPELLDIDIQELIDKKDMYEKACELLSVEKLSEILKDNLYSFSGVTDGYWKDIEPKGNNYMILDMDYDDHVRPLGASREDLSYYDINEKFVILDGIDYKSNDASHKLLYMEV